MTIIPTGSGEQAAWPYSGIAVGTGCTKFRQMTNWEPLPILPYQALRKKGTVKLERKRTTEVQLLSFLKHW